MTVRATAPFGDGSDFIDDDPTSPNDIDAATFEAPFTVLAAEAGVSITADVSVALIDAGIDELPLTLAVRSIGALAGAVVELPVSSHPSVTITGCDVVDAGLCRVAVGDLPADMPVERTLIAPVDRAGMGASGLLDTPITASVTSAGGAALDLDPATISTAGARVAIDAAEADVTDAEMTSTSP